MKKTPYPNFDKVKDITKFKKIGFANNRIYLSNISSKYDNTWIIYILSYGTYGWDFETNKCYGIYFHPTHIE